MQKLQQALWMLADQLRKALHTDELPGEIALLITWKHLSDKGADSIPTLQSVIEGEISLKAAYEQIVKAVGQQGDAFLSSKLPRRLTGHQVEDVLSAVVKIPETDGAALYYALIELVSEASNVAYEESSLPEELVELMASFATSSADEVYAPFPLSMQLAATMALNGKKSVYESQFVSSPLSCAAAQLTGITWIQSDPIRSPLVMEQGQLRSFPTVVMAPPFGIRYKEHISDPYHRFSKDTSNGDVMAIEHGLSQCSGRLVTIAPVGMLFRGANDYDLRTQLINSGWLEAVIQLPAGLLPHTNIPVAVLIIDKQREPAAPVLLCDADQPQWVKQGGRGRSNKLVGWKEIREIVTQRKAEGPAVLVTEEQIKANEYDLSVSRYVLGKASLAMQALEKKEKMARLEDVAELIRAQALKEDKTPHGDEYLEVGPKDIGDDGYITEPEKCLKLSGRTRDRAELQRLHPGDVLLVTKGSVGKVALVGDNCGDNWVASQAFQVIRTGSNSQIQSPEYLYRYLASPLVKAYLGEQTTGTTIPMLSTREIKGLLVPVPTVEQQQKVCQTHQDILAAHERIRAIQQEIKALDQQHWPFDSKDDASDNA